MNVSLLSRAEPRDIADLRHPERVRQYSVILARQLMSDRRGPGEPDERFVRLLELASPMHDVGKQALPQRLLLKPAPLAVEEYEIVKTHTALGAGMLAAAAQRLPHLEHLPMASQIAATHHEHWDGSGYPNRLAGADIPLCGRIVAVADVYDALTSSRVYKAALDHEAAKKMILAGAGRKFDPRVVQAFLGAEDAMRAAAQADIAQRVAA